MKNQNYPKVFVVILNYNGGNLLLTCLKHVYQSSYPNFEVVVVDNNSTDGSFEKARLKFSAAHFIRNSANLGFAKGNNLGIRFALEKFSNFVFVLNNDALIKKDTLSALIKTATNFPSAGIISPLITKNQHIWFAGGVIDWKRMKAKHLNKPLSAQPYTTEYISGCSMLVKEDVFEKIGLFDERYFLYYEDADFSLRAQRNDFDLLIDPSIQINHLEKSSRNFKKNYWLVISALLFFRTHDSLLQKIYHAIYFQLRKLKNFVDLIFLKKHEATIIRRAYQDYSKTVKNYY